MKIFSLSIIFFISACTLQAQTFLDRYFSSFGFGIDAGTSPLQFEGPFPDVVGFDTLYDYVAFQDNYWGISTCYSGRYNFIESGEDLAFSVSGKPVFSFGFSSTGFFEILFPLGLGVEWGNGATYKTSSDFGLNFTVGYSLNYTPFFKHEEVKEDERKAEKYNVAFKTFWGCPFVSLGFRYWSKINTLREINFLYGFPEKGDKLPGNLQSMNVLGTDWTRLKDSSFMFRISWVIYVGY
jgi:hypothetical protein